MLHLTIKKTITRTVAALAVFLISAQSSLATPVAPVKLEFNNNSIEAEFTLNSAIEVDLSLAFDNSIGLHPSNFDITAELVSLTDPDVLNRLPSSLVQMRAAFPVVVSVKPKAGAGFGFEGMAAIELYTKAMHYNSNIPLRIFRSHDNGTFEDITMLTSAGSIRARGNLGGFSDFMIMLDTRLPDAVISHKYQLAEQLLTDNRSDIEATLLNQIDTQMTSLDSALSGLDYSQALTATDALISLIDNASGNDIPDVWRSSNDLVNVKGEMLTWLNTLRYSLRIY